MKRSKTVTFKIEILRSAAVSVLHSFGSSVGQTLNINFMYKVDRSS